MQIDMYYESPIKNIISVFETAVRKHILNPLKCMYIFTFESDHDQLELISIITKPAVSATLGRIHVDIYWDY